MAATTHHRPRCVILSNATPLRGGRRGMQAGAPECPPGPREQGSGLCGSSARPSRRSRRSRRAGCGASELTRLPDDTAAPAEKLCKQKKSRFIDRAKAASAKEPGEPRHRGRRERGWVLRSTATSQGAVKIPGPSGVSVCADVKAGGPGSHHGLTDVTLAPTRSLISTVDYLISLGK